MELSEKIGVALILTIMVGGSFGAAMLYYINSLEVHEQRFHLLVQPDEGMNATVRIHIPFPLDSDLETVEVLMSGVSDMADSMGYLNYSQFNTTEYHFLNLTLNSSETIHIVCLLDGEETAFYDSLEAGVPVTLESSNLTVKCRIMYFHYQEGDNRCDAFFVELYDKDSLTFKQMVVNDLYAEVVPVELAPGGNILEFEDQSVKMY